MSASPLGPKNIAVIGAGPMGLICAYRLLQQGHRVCVFERDDRIGGMSASFDFAGTRIERFYHFICRNDRPLLSLLEEFGLSRQLNWRDTKKGFFFEGRLYNWDNPRDLLAFPHISLFSKIRYALHIFYSSHASNWSTLDRQAARTWLHRWLGKSNYRLLWKTLLHYKYYELAGDISAAWIAARIRRVAKSTRGFFIESLGYLEGGSETLLNAMEARISSLGGTIRLSNPVDQLVCVNRCVAGLIVAGRKEYFDMVISTVPLPYVPAFAPDLSPAILDRIGAIRNIGVVCVLFKLCRPLTDKFWTNINDSRMEIPGIIEYSNLCPMPESLLYVPYYLPHSHPKYTHNNGRFVEEAMSYLRFINPEFHEDWIMASTVTRYAFAQPVCHTGFFNALPPMITDIAGFIMADTTYYYPEDRSISESIKLGQHLATLVA